jgi:hypothetical protein
VKVVTANRLGDGAVIYIGADGGFVERIALAARLGDDAAQAALDRARQFSTVIASAYLIDADEDGPTGRERLRETIRMNGPTIRTDLGKQAEAIDERL